MRTAPNDAAFPQYDGGVFEFGLTKREWFAAHIMAGIIANPTLQEEAVVGAAIQMADALIKALNKEGPA